MSAVHTPAFDHARRDLLGSIDELSIRDLAELVERSESYASEDALHAIPAELAARYGMRAERIGTALVQVATEIDVPFYNRVLGLGLSEPIDDATLDAVDHIYRGHDVRAMLQMSPAVLDATLHARLEARGYKRMDNWSQLVRGTEPPPDIATDLRVEQVGAEHAQAHAEIVTTCFGLPLEYAPFLTGLVGRPGWQHYLAFDGPTPVAAGALYVRGLVGYLTYGATLESHRRRGAQGTIMARRIRDGAALGCRWLVTGAVEDTPERPNPSYHNMLRTGFRLAYQRPNYVYFPVANR